VLRLFFVNATPQVEYDPRLTSYRQLLDVFWSSHDSRQALGQGPMLVTSTGDGNYV